ncbi:MAG: GntR family transcriptional regulator [Spirochaetaceae bacterium]
MELKYKRVIEHLINIFNVESYVTGKQLPTEFEIMDQLGVSRNTVRKAILEMEKDGLVKRKHGSGTFYVGNTTPEIPSGGLIGLVNFSGMGYIFPEIIKGVEDTLYSSGFSIVLAGSCSDPERELTSLKLLKEQNVKGLIMDLSRYFNVDTQVPVLELVKSFNIPVITTHWSGTLKEFSTVYINDELAGYDATNYLIEKGHTKIGMVYKNNTQAGCFRYNGYCRALKEAGIAYDESKVTTYADFDESHDVAHAYTCTEELLDATNRDITAIFYYTDKCAMEGYKAIEKNGLSIPNDISVLGFDNYQSSMLISPALTTFNHPKYELGRWAAKMLLDEISEEEVHQAKSLRFEPHIIERDSVKEL